jgi:phosphoribosylformylglycinamidine synthase
LSFEPGNRADLALFAESASRIVVSVAPDNVDAVGRLAAARGLPWQVLGQVTDSGQLVWGEGLDVSLKQIESAHANGLGSIDN